MDQITVTIGGKEKTSAPVLSKKKFADLVERVPGTITHWLKPPAKISGAALVGKGRTAKIDVLKALAQLGDTLDWSQQLTQKTPITPQASSQPDLLDAAAEPGAAPPAATESITGELANRLALARVLDAENKASRSQLDLMNDQGKWLSAEDVTRATKTLVAALTQKLDELPRKIAREVAAELGVDEKVLALAVKAALTEQRRRWSQQFSLAAEEAATAETEDRPPRSTQTARAAE